MKTYSLLFSLLFCVYGFSQTNYKTLKESSNIAVKANKGILLVHVNTKESKTELDKKLNSLKDTFVIHYVDMSKSSGLTEDQLLLNKRLEGSYNANNVYPTINVLGMYAEKKGVTFSGGNDTTLNEFILSLKAR